ncbi:MAG: N-acetylglutamate synthase [Herbinix sp.]|jgi:ribosomal protein S18 acetylase RimI-like enzyme|nr:N-acetylglutamate synthase [Herbinix sp.]
MIRPLTIDDYDEVYQLWKGTPGVGLRSMDDSKDGIRRFLGRNPYTNFVAEEDGHIIGVVLGGHDGRRGYIYHTCVDENYRRRSIGRELIERIIIAMKEERITKIGLVCFAENNKGNEFWSGLGWEQRSDLNYFTISIDENNI